MKTAPEPSRRVPQGRENGACGVLLLAVGCFETVMGSARGGGACFLASRAFTSKQATQVSLPYRGPKDGTTQLARRNGIYPLEVGLPTRRPDAKDVGNGAKLNMLADP